MYIEWSKWSTCSRSCDGGVSSRDRHCFATSKFGKKVRCKTKTSELDTMDRKKYPNRREYKICNTQPCSSLTSQMSSKSFRTQQCSQYNNSPYKVSYGKNLYLSNIRISFVFNCYRYTKIKKLYRFRVDITTG